MQNNQKKITTSKSLLIAVFLLSVEIIIFSEIMMNKYGDFTAMYALIGIPATLIPVVCGYFSKSKAENTSGGITYDMAMMNYEHNQSENNDSVG